MPRLPRISRTVALRLGLVALFAYVAAVALASAYTRYAVFSERDLAEQLPDTAWQLELAWRAERGEWSGRDFHYTMGPLWQALLWLASAGDPIDPRHTLVAIQLLFAAVCVALASWVALRVVESPARRLLAVAVAVTLAYGAGPATLRALASVAVIVLYAAELEREPSWRSAFVVSGALAVSLLLSFDRAALGAASIVVMAACELWVRRRRGTEPRLAWRRFGRWLAAQSATLAAFGVLGLVAGASPIAYVAGQRAITADYGAALGTTWKLGVRRETIAMFVLCAAATAASMLIPKRGRWVGGVLLAGALPAMGFAIVQPDDGHMYIALVPVAVLLVLTALAAPLAERGPRVACALLGYAFVVGWFTTHPGNFWVSPRALAEARDTWRETKTAPPDYATDVGAALDWLAIRPPREQASCLAVSAPLAILHPLTGRRGPTELPLLWSFERERERDEAVRSTRCPAYVYFFVSYDTPGHPFLLRPEMLTVSELYRVERRLSSAVYALRLREQPSPVIRRELEPAVTGGEVSVPGELAIPLGRTVPGHHALEIEYSHEVSPLAVRTGSRPAVEFSFARGEAEVTPFERTKLFGVGQRVKALLAADPEGVERRLILDEQPHRDRSADTLRLRFLPIGMLSPSSVRFTLHAVRELVPGTPPSPEPDTCSGAGDLLASVDRKDALLRDVQAVREPTGLWLAANAPGAHIAEALFPVAPCADTCFRADVVVKDGAGDGVDLEAHVLDHEQRTRLVAHRLPAGFGPEATELPLYPWAGRDVVLRVGVSAGADLADNQLLLAEPRTVRCSGRTQLANALREGSVRTEAGELWAHEDDVWFGARGGRLAYDLGVFGDTCLRGSVDVEGPPGVRGEVAAHFAIGGLRHRLFRYLLGPDDPPIELRDLSLHDWLGQRGVLTLSARFLAGSADARAVVRGARVGRCRER